MEGAMRMEPLNPTIKEVPVMEPFEVNLATAMVEGRHSLVKDTVARLTQQLESIVPLTPQDQRGTIEQAIAALKRA
jgi:hypothetical protein